MEAMHHELVRSTNKEAYGAPKKFPRRITKSGRHNRDFRKMLVTSILHGLEKRLPN